MPGFVLRKTGGGGRRRLRSRACSSSSAFARFRAIRRPRSAVRTTIPPRCRRSGTSTCSTGRCPCSTDAGSGSRVQGDLGRDQRGLPVAHTIVTRLPLTLELATLSLLIAILIGIPAGVIAAVRRGKASDHAATDRGADRPVGAALLARPADDHLVRGRPALAAGDRATCRCATRSTNLRHMVMPCIVLGTGLRREPDAPDALGDARLARIRLRADGAGEGPERVERDRRARASQQPDHGRDPDRARLRRAHLRCGRDGDDLRHRRLRTPLDRRDQHARLPDDPGHRARHGAGVRGRQPRRRRHLLGARPANQGRGGAEREHGPPSPY